MLDWQWLIGQAGRHAVAQPSLGHSALPHKPCIPLHTTAPPCPRTAPHRTAAHCLRQGMAAHLPFRSPSCTPPAGVINVCLTTFWVGRWPSTYHLFWLIKDVVLFSLRFFSYKRRGMHYM